MVCGMMYDKVEGSIQFLKLDMYLKFSKYFHCVSKKNNLVNSYLCGNGSIITVAPMTQGINSKYLAKYL